MWCGIYGLKFFKTLDSLGLSLSVLSLSSNDSSNEEGVQISQIGAISVRLWVIYLEQDARISQDPKSPLMIIWDELHLMASASAKANSYLEEIPILV